MGYGWDLDLPGQRSCSPTTHADNNALVTGYWWFTPRQMPYFQCLLAPAASGRMNGLENLVITIQCGPFVTATLKVMQRYYSIRSISHRKPDANIYRGCRYRCVLTNLVWRGVRMVHHKGGAILAGNQR